MINIVIPMAGKGQRFQDAGYIKPKPFIRINSKPMIVHVMENLKYKNARYILLSRQEHIEAEKETIDEMKKTYDVEFIPIEKLTEGAACTVLHGRRYINNDSPLLIANCDQLIDMDISKYINDCFERGLDGSILTFQDTDTKWSYAKLGHNNLVEQVKEKECISKNATVGIYLYTKGKYFVDYAIDMIVNNDRVNNEFYVCPAYNYAIADNKKIGIYNIDQSKMHGIGTPEDLNKYLELMK